MMDADFRIDPAAAPELAGHLRTLAGRYARAAGEPVPLDGSPASPPDRSSD
jgi:hypothetical protein